MSESMYTAIIYREDFNRLKQWHRPCKPCSDVYLYRIDAFTIYSYTERDAFIIIEFLHSLPEGESMEKCKKYGMIFD